MHAILNEGQISSISSVFEKNALEISASRINMPEQFNFNWESVASHSPQGAWFPNEEFLANIDKYKYNKFINIGNTKYSNLCLTPNLLIFRALPPLSLPVQAHY